MNQVPTTKRNEERNAMRVARLAKKPNQTIRESQTNEDARCFNLRFVRDPQRSRLGDCVGEKHR